MQPIQYNRVYHFTGYQTSSPSVPLPGNQVDVELNAIKATTDAIRANLAIIQRDDTLLCNNTVHPDAFNHGVFYEHRSPVHQQNFGLRYRRCHGRHWNRTH